MKKAKSDVRSLRFGASHRWGVGAAFFAAAFLIGGIGTAGAVSLEDAVRAAVNTNPDIGVVAKDRLAIDQELRQGKALYYPSVDGAVTAGYDWVLGKASALPGTTGRLWKQDNSITITQTLFDGFAAASEVQRQKARVDSAALRVIATSESVALDAVQAYLDVVRTQQLYNLAEDNKRTHERYLQDMKSRLRGGTGSMADVRQAESRLARAFATLAEEKGNVANAEAAYIKVVGEPPESLTQPASVDNLLPPSVDMAVAIAVESSPPVAIANADIRVAQAELRASRADFYPKIDLELAEQWNRNDSGVKGSNREELALVVMKWNIFRGGETVAKNEEFVQRLAESREVLGQSERSVEQEARLSWNDLQSAKNQVAAIETQVLANEKVRDAYTQQFNLGQRSLLDVLDSENELFVSRGDLVAAQFVDLFAGYRLLAVQGQLISSMGVKNRPEGMTMEQQEMAEDDPEGASTKFALADEDSIMAEVDDSLTDEEEMTTEGATEVEPAEDTKQAAQAPSEGFKEASGEVTDDSVMSLNFNPVWSVE